MSGGASTLIGMATTPTSPLSSSSVPMPGPRRPAPPAESGSMPTARRVMADGSVFGDGPVVGYVFLVAADTTVWPPRPAGWVFETADGYRSPFPRETEQAAVTALLALEHDDDPEDLPRGHA